MSGDTKKSEDEPKHTMNRILTHYYH